MLDFYAIGDYSNRRLADHCYIMHINSKATRSEWVLASSFEVWEGIQGKELLQGSTSFSLRKLLWG